MTRVLLKRFIRKSFFFSQEAFQYHYTILCPIELCSHYWKLRIEFCYPCECLDLLLWRELVLKVAPEGNLQNNINVIWTWGNIMFFLLTHKSVDYNKSFVVSFGLGDLWAWILTPSLISPWRQTEWVTVFPLCLFKWIPLFHGHFFPFTWKVMWWHHSVPPSRHYLSSFRSFPFPQSLKNYKIVLPSM